MIDQRWHAFAWAWNTVLTITWASGVLWVSVGIAMGVLSMVLTIIEREYQQRGK